MKTCRHCDKSLPTEAFPRNVAVSDHLSSWCRRCHAAAIRDWREANAEHVRAYRKKRRPIENAQARALWARNADAINAKRRRRYAAARGVAK